MFVDSAKPDKIVRRWTGSQHTPGAFLKGWHPAHPTFYARRTCFEQYGDFDLSFEISADFELMLRFIEKMVVAIIILTDVLSRCVKAEQALVQLRI